MLLEPLLRPAGHVDLERARSPVAVNACFVFGGICTTEVSVTGSVTPFTVSSPPPAMKYRSSVSFAWTCSAILVPFGIVAIAAGNGTPAPSRKIGVSLRGDRREHARHDRRARPVHSSRRRQRTGPRRALGTTRRDDDHGVDIATDRLDLARAPAGT